MAEIKNSTVDNERFATVLTINEKNGQAKNHSKSSDYWPESSSLTTLTAGNSEMLEILQRTNFSHLSTKDILDTLNRNHLRELSLQYSLLNEELLRALGDCKISTLETLRIEAHPETKPVPRISVDTWFAFANRLPNINLVLLSYMTEEEDFKSIIEVCVPLTHLFLGNSTPSAIVDKIGSLCPRLVELVISAYDPETLDQALISVALGCPGLSAVGLGDCEITCSGFVKFVESCHEKLHVLYVWETSLLEDMNFDVAKVITQVSSHLSRSWQPEYVPFW